MHLIIQPVNPIIVPSLFSAYSYAHGVWNTFLALWAWYQDARCWYSLPLISVIEGSYLMEQGISPYEGDMVHEPPLTLLLYSFLIQNYTALIPAVFILVDLLTAHILKLTADNFVKKQVMMLCRLSFSFLFQSVCELADHSIYWNHSSNTDWFHCIHHLASCLAN